MNVSHAQNCRDPAIPENKTACMSCYIWSVNKSKHYSLGFLLVAVQCCWGLHFLPSSNQNLSVWVFTRLTLTRYWQLQLGLCSGHTGGRNAIASSYPGLKLVMEYLKLISPKPRDPEPWARKSRVLTHLKPKVDLASPPLTQTCQNPITKEYIP